MRGGGVAAKELTLKFNCEINKVCKFGHCSGKTVMAGENSSFKFGSIKKGTPFSGRAWSVKVLAIS